MWPENAPVRRHCLGILLEVCITAYIRFLHVSKRCHVAVDVVVNFRSAVGVYGTPKVADSNFDVAFARRKKRDEAIGQAAFAAHPRDDGCGHK